MDLTSGLHCTECNSVNPCFPEMPSTLMFLEKLRGVTPVLYDSTTTQQLQVQQQQQQQQQQMMEDQQHAGVDQLAQFPCEYSASWPIILKWKISLSEPARCISRPESLGIFILDLSHVTYFILTSEGRRQNSIGY